MSKIIETHISMIRTNDTVIHNDKEMTVCAKDITSCKFMGIALFGDSYKLGHKLVKKVV